MKRAAFILAFFISAGLLPGPAHADKLVVFRNGKALLVKSVDEGDGWLKCEFEDGNFMSVPMKSVKNIQDSVLQPSRSVTANQVSEGGPGYTRGGAVSPGPGGRNLGREQADQLEAAPPTDEAAIALQEEEAIRSAPQPGLPRSFRRGTRTPGNNAAGNIQNPAGLTPLNQVRAPFGGRGAVGSRNPGRVVDPSQDQQPQPNQNADSDDDN